MRWRRRTYLHFFSLSQPFSCTAAAVVKIVMIIFLNHHTAKRNTTTSSADADVTVIHKKIHLHNIFSRTKQNTRRHDDDDNDHHDERERREEGKKVERFSSVCLWESAMCPCPGEEELDLTFSLVCWSSALDLALCIVMMIIMMMKRCSQGFWCEDDDVLCM